MGRIKVIKPGPLTLIQDIGRMGICPLGVVQGGPLDEYAYCWVNTLLDNEAGTPALEIHHGDAEFVFTDDCMAAICGGDLQATLDGDPIDNWSTFHIKKDQTLKFGSPVNGFIAYLTVFGGLDVEPQLGSTSTVTCESLGGLNQNGLPLSAGDEVPYHNSKTEQKPHQLSFNHVPDYNLPLRLRLIESYQFHDFSPEARKMFYKNIYRVEEPCNRTRYKLRGLAIETPSNVLISEGNALGSVQIPPDGQPRILLNDRHTLDAYPKIGVIGRIDQPRIAQARPGHEVRFIRGNRKHLQSVWNAWALRFGY